MHTLERGRPLTVDDLEAMPDDGNRYELIDGVLVVSAAPIPRHQRVGMRLLILLDEAAPDGVWALPAPTDVELDQQTMVEPDIVVARRDAFDERRLPTSPMLAVEVSSPSTAVTDLNVKFARYERAAIPSYWVVDPEKLRLTAWDLHDGRYVEVADIGPGESWTATQPFEVSIEPGTLLD